MPLPTVKPAATPASIASAFGGEAPKALIRPNAPFFLVHHQGRQGSWEVVLEGFDEPHFVPVLTAIPLVPGVHVQTRESGQTLESALKPMRDSLARQGSIVLDESLGYMVAVECIDPRTREQGKYYHLACERLVSSGLPDVPDTVDIDLAEWNRFRLEVFEAGLVPPPSGAVLEAMERRLRLRKDKVAEVKEEGRSDARTKLAALRNAFDAAVRPWAPKPTNADAGAEPKNKRGGRAKPKASAEAVAEGGA